MNIREALAPKIAELNRADAMAYTAYKMRPRLRPRSAIVRERRQVATEELKQEAVRLGLTGFLMWIKVLWTIAQIVREITARWDSQN